ncbi:uncharacterized protein BYT42DRAFT_129112 [Radiomyces spectabilis]|uniref:uncharacterized protein n=1 Tax=Radiomyces spectabilis TaxID=64574 RepID=UPI00222056DD|nr:uncharacterized protein BYT42DRAFT_129112 [Radiomyces spectabilis]KAI8367513.1 hypothetical protein BYT42DRAFT_129112 [Radiomyces spectabilis]
MDPSDRIHLGTLVAKLRSDNDRRRYTRLLAISQDVQSRIRELQRSQHQQWTAYDDEDDSWIELYFPLNSDTGTAADTYQPKLRPRIRLAERSHSLRRDIDQLSKQYSTHFVFSRTMLIPAPTLHPSISTQHTACFEDIERSCSPGLPCNSLSTSPSMRSEVSTDCDSLFSAVEGAYLSDISANSSFIPPTDSSLFPSLTVKISGKQATDRSFHHQPLTPPYTPPDSPRDSLPCSITHIQKKIQGLRGLLTRSFMLNNILVYPHINMAPLEPSNYQFQKAMDVSTHQPKAVLKLALSKTIPLAEEEHLSCYGFTFSTPKQKSSSSEDYVASLSLIPNSLVNMALLSWTKHMGDRLPPLSDVSHIFRLGIKIYLVYNDSGFRMT